MSNNWLDEAVARQNKYDEGYESGYQMGKRVTAELIFKDICRLGGCSQGIVLNVWDIQELKEKWGYKVIMELNKDKIMKCLRHCNGGDCENCKALGTACDATWKFHKEALRLIKELIAENEQLRLTTIKTVQEKIHQAAEASGVNKYEAQYVNQVVMLSDVDKVIYKMLEEANEQV